jgi:hypothetical protein
MIVRFRKVGMIQDDLDSKLRKTSSEIQKKGNEMDSLLDGCQLTNVGTFMAYIEACLYHHPDHHTERMTFHMRSLPPEPKGLPSRFMCSRKCWNGLNLKRSRQISLITCLLLPPILISVSPKNRPIRSLPGLSVPLTIDLSLKRDLIQVTSWVIGLFGSVSNIKIS